MGYRQAGKSTYDLAEKRRKSGLKVGIIILILMSIVGIYFMNQSVILSLGGGVTVIMLLLLIVLPDFLGKFLRKNHMEEKRAVRGAEAEVKVGLLLAGLDPNEYLIYHDIRSPYGNIDHIIIKNTGGVFLIETKSHGGKVKIQKGQVYVNNKRPEKDFIKQILNNTYWLKNRLQTKSGKDAWVLPVLVFTNAIVEYSAPIQGINIINAKYLIIFIQNNNSSSLAGKQMWDLWKKPNIPITG